MSALSKYEEAIRTYPQRGDGLHAHIMKIACLGVIADLPDDTIYADIKSLNGCRPDEGMNEIAKARREAGADNYEPYIPTRHIPEVKNGLAKFIAGVDNHEMDLYERSKTRIVGDPERDGHEVLSTLYNPDDILFIGSIYDKAVRPVSDWLNLDLRKYPHIIPNPVTGKMGETKNGTVSCRCDAVVKNAKYAVCEMDGVSFKEQVAFWVKCVDLGLPVACVVSSGGKSLHGWMKVDCGDDAEKWAKEVKAEFFGGFGLQYGLDQACSNRARLSRLAGHNRDGGSIQQLLYLDGGMK